MREREESRRTSRFLVEVTTWIVVSFLDTRGTQERNGAYEVGLEILSSKYFCNILEITGLEPSVISEATRMGTGAYLECAEGGQKKKA